MKPALSATSNSKIKISFRGSKIYKQLCPSDNGRSDYEDLFIATKVKILGILKCRGGSASMDVTQFNASVAPAVHSSRLPSIKLPKFDGKYAEYERFITAFNNLVHENHSITDVDKFNYLLNSLSGPALAVVEPFQVTEQNYGKALKRLKERYDNKVDHCEKSLILFRLFVVQYCLSVQKWRC